MKYKIFLPILWAFFNLFNLYAAGSFLAGSEDGLYEVNGFEVTRLWSDAKIYKIVKAADKWLFLTDKGVAVSKNLRAFSYLNAALPKKIIKHIDEKGNKTFIEKMPQLKDLEVHPSNPMVFVTASSSKVFLTTDAGKTWQDLGANGFINGIKAVYAADFPDGNGRKRLTVFVSHALYGLAWMQPEVNAKIWYELNNGLGRGPEVIEEVSDITFNYSADDPAVYCSQTFSGNIFKLNWKQKRFEKVYTPKEKSLTYVDSLSVHNKTIIGVKNGGIFNLDLILPNVKQYASQSMFKNFNKVKRELVHSRYLCAFIPDELTPFKNGVSLSELWLLRAWEKTGYLKKADGKKGLYIPVHQVLDEKQFSAHLKMIKEYKLNAVVIDMKDEAGLVRYNSKKPDIQKFGGVKNPINLEKLVERAKSENLYVIARIVAFKDKNLYAYANGKYAVKNKLTKGPWQGYRMNGDERDLIQEHWVDPYNEEVWGYIADIAEELSLRGVGEIQFDYIRFPTDGDNLSAAVYPASGHGMDKESAIMSFLAYMRSRIKAPISIDIYGSNGWYRTGARTGQEVELLTEYVDVLCPMFYPSHFSQSFLAYKPAEERPYRIYYQGTWRNKMIARNKAVVRPWAQAFYLPVSYDKKYYDKDYVKRQIIGTGNSVNEGYIYWNNSGKYGDIRPDGESLK